MPGTIEFSIARFDDLGLDLLLEGFARRALVLGYRVEDLRVNVYPDGRRALLTPLGEVCVAWVSDGDCKGRFEVTGPVQLLGPSSERADRKPDCFGREFRVGSPCDRCDSRLKCRTAYHGPCGPAYPAGSRYGLIRRSNLRKEVIDET